MKRKNQRYDTLKTQGFVDMSRMTGRGGLSLKHDDSESIFFDTNKSLEKIKQKTAVNINFDKQISR